MWYTHYGLKDNPFKITPDPKMLVGYAKNIERLKIGIESGNMLGLIGCAGFGKTTILKYLASACGDAATPVYHDCSLGPVEEFNMKQLLLKPSFFGLIKRPYEKSDRVVFFCDEVQRLPEGKAEEIKAHYDAGLLHSVVLVTIDEMNITSSMRSRISETIALEPLGPEEFVELAKKRIGKGINPFTDEALRELAMWSSFNPRTFLINAERICKSLYATHDREGSINEELVRLHVGKKAPAATTAPMRHSGAAVVPMAPIEAAAPEKSEVRETRTAAAQAAQMMQAPPKSIADIRGVLSPLQDAIVSAMASSNVSLTCAEIATTVGKSEGSVAKQLSRLAMISDVDLMRRKGLSEPLVVKKQKPGGAVFDLVPTARTLLTKK